MLINIVKPISIFFELYGRLLPDAVPKVDILATYLIAAIATTAHFVGQRAVNTEHYSRAFFSAFIGHSAVLSPFTSLNHRFSFGRFTACLRGCHHHGKANDAAAGPSTGESIAFFLQWAGTAVGP